MLTVVILFDHHVVLRRGSYGNRKAKSGKTYLSGIGPHVELELKAAYLCELLAKLVSSHLSPEFFSGVSNRRQWIRMNIFVFASG